MEKGLHITITTGTVIRVILALLCVWAVFYLRELLYVILTAIVISSAIEPAARKLVARRIPRVLAVILIYLSFFAFFAIIFYFFLPSVLSDLANAISQLPAYMSELTHTTAFDEFAKAVGVSSLPVFSPDTVLAPLRSLVGDVSSGAFAAASKLFGGIVSLLLVFVFSFYFAVAETGVDDFLRVVMPINRQDYAIGLWKRTQHKIGLWMQGQLILGLIMGVLVYLGLTILGVPNALTLAIFAAVCEIIPVFGPIISAVPAVAIAFVSGGLALGLATVALYIINQQFENHLIYPLVVTKIVGVPPLLVILSLLVGAHVAGFWGILLSVPVAATIKELVSDLQSHRLANEPRS